MFGNENAILETDLAFALVDSDSSVNIYKDRTLQKIYPTGAKVVAKSGKFLNSTSVILFNKETSKTSKLNLISKAK